MDPTIVFMGQILTPDTVRVSACGAEIHATDIEALVYLKNLRQLNLNTTNVCNEHLHLIGTLTQLEDLDLSCTDITDSGLEHLRTLSNLKHLRIKENHIGDAGIGYLEHLTNLETLNLKGLKITKKGLEYLARMPCLEQIVFSYPEFSRADLDTLQAALPNCEIIVQNPAWVNR